MNMITIRDIVVFIVFTPDDGNRANLCLLYEKSVYCLYKVSYDYELCAILGVKAKV
jgi:hypothetical protein